ncbi:MAG: inositol 2-dehydrogenase [Verrucomicrobia bacterium]|nr:inositol 2-dehydrogenase [Verrucomicrobiota bacterium]
MAERGLNVGIVGAGRIGRLHAENLCRRLPQARLRMIGDLVESAARDCARRLELPDWTTDYRQLVEHPDVQAVLICSSTDTHTEIIEAAAAAGKHIFCEKPIDADLGRIDRALAAVDRAGVLMQVGFNRRFDANFQRVRQAVTSGEIGTPHQVRIASRDPGPPPLDYIRKSGGLFLDMTIHDFDMARFLVGAEVEEVYATGGVRVDPAIGEAGDLDTALVVLKFANGVTGTIENCRQAVYGYDQRVEVFGSGGSILADNCYPNNALIQGQATIYRDRPLHFFLERYAESFVAELQAFFEAILEERPSPLSGAEGRLPVVMAHAARRSWAENRPVRLAEIG